MEVLILSKSRTSRFSVQLGEVIDKPRILDQAGYKNILAIQNGSGNGIDVVAELGNGQWAVFEVKTTVVGKVPPLSARQKDMGKFLEDVLSQASTKIRPISRNQR